MTRYITIAFLFVATITSYGQSLGYQDLGILFSQNDNNGSARFTAMSGAFGALGGDISSININPAGISVFNTSAFSGTFNSRKTDIAANYYDKSTSTKDSFFNLSQAGAVLVFDSAYETDWNKFAIGFNYRITKDFTNSFLAVGNSGIPTFRNFPLDETINYDIADEQQFFNDYKGEISEFNIAFSAVHQKKLHIGLSLNFYDLDFSQQSQLTEFNRDINNNLLDVDLFQENFITGTGFSANAGFIYKAHPNFRFGLSYQTPTWYSEILQDTNYGFDNDNNIDTETLKGTTVYFNGNESVTESNNWQLDDYKLNTPSKLTASAAFIFEKKGLLSIDYINKNYQNIKLSNGDYKEANVFFQNELRNTHSFNIGTEWRFDKFSVRGGYQFEQSPDKLATSSNNLKGHSLGAGYNFGGFKLDFAYNNNNRTKIYNFYSQFDNISPAELEIDNRTITASITLDL